MPDLDRLDQCVALAQALWFLPEKSRVQVADGMYKIGARVHPELAVQDEAHDLLARSLWFMPAPIRPAMADSLYMLGIRVHSELATQEITHVGAQGLASHRPRRLVDVKSRREDMMRQVAPELYDKLQAADTEQQKQTVLAEIRARVPAWLAEAEQRSAAMPQEPA